MHPVAALRHHHTLLWPFQVRYLLPSPIPSSPAPVSVPTTDPPSYPSTMQVRYNNSPFPTEPVWTLFDFLSRPWLLKDSMGQPPTNATNVLAVNGYNLSATPPPPPLYPSSMVLLLESIDCLMQKLSNALIIGKWWNWTRSAGRITGFTSRSVTSKARAASVFTIDSWDSIFALWESNVFSSIAVWFGTPWRSEPITSEFYFFICTVGRNSKFGTWNEH